MSFAQTLKRPAGARASYDESLVWAGVLLLGIGLVMVYSASIAIAEGRPLQPRASRAIS